MSLAAKENALNRADLLRISSIISARFGLHFQEHRFFELEKKIISLCKELGIADISALEKILVQDSLSEDKRMSIARHLTVGETFFFRDFKVFALFKDVIMGEIISLKKTAPKQIRILSAGCSTGEEPYSIAIVVHRHFEHLKDWHISITAIDVNDESLDKAVKGVYRDWSFRGAPEWLKGGYFLKKGKDKYELSETIRSMVQFSHFNLASDPEDFYRMFSGFDVIFCRNVIMYFNEELRHTIAEMFYRSLVRGGWLIVSPVEASSLIFGAYETLTFDKITLFRKSLSDSLPANADNAINERPNKPLVSATTIQVEKSKEQPNRPIGKEVSDSLNQGENLLPAGTIKSEHITQDAYQVDSSVKQRSSVIEKARNMADLGRHDEALSLLEGLVRERKLDTEAYYLMALILEEKGELHRAEAALKKVIYIESDSALARFRLGNIFFKSRKNEEALREFNNVISILEKQNQDQSLKDFGDMNVKRIIDLSRSIIKEIEML